ncbi:hypothetical protein SAMN05444143_10795 [Flavobacterium succinicans]|uniref:Uncharacterized protein n=1 Tax=Flavobacterium succinicans TaxID=29536 RepID=A0A1I4WTU7_9FLAO|nr:hypothetical protein [Flavobacterium succinicans]SFN16772.1 hypothetical protein SAMN05444143_10795 [Flavobacterium succinicans]
MNEHLKELLTPENVLSYSNACYKVCEILIELKDENYKRLIIPSRGAYPFYNGALTSINFLTDSRSERMNFNLHFDLWLLPYTSDWGQADIKTNSKAVRKFWSKILADSIRKESTPYTFFYNKLVDLIGSRLTINTTDLKVDKYYKNNNIDNEKFIFIDTAISGKAICDIIESFYEFNLTDFFIIMITDCDGNKLKPEYKKIIEKEKQLNRLIQINVKNIYSEDASPLLNTGISSIVFPSLIERAYNEIDEFKKNQFVGAGLWFIDSVSHLKELNPKINGVRGILATLNYRGLSNIFGKEDIWFEESTKDEVENMIKRLGNFNLLDGSSTKELIYDRISSRKTKFEEDVDVSSSHIIRINLHQDIITELIKPIKYK